MCVCVWWSHIDWMRRMYRRFIWSHYYCSNEKKGEAINIGKKAISGSSHTKRMRRFGNAKKSCNTTASVNDVNYETGFCRFWFSVVFIIVVSCPRKRRSNKSIGTNYPLTRRHRIKYFFDLYRCMSLANYRWCAFVAFMLARVVCIYANRLIKWLSCLTHVSGAYVQTIYFSLCLLIEHVSRLNGSCYRLLRLRFVGTMTCIKLRSVQRTSGTRTNKTTTKSNNKPLTHKIKPNKKQQIERARK